MKGSHACSLQRIKKSPPAESISIVSSVGSMFEAFVSLGSSVALYEVPKKLMAYICPGIDTDYMSERALIANLRASILQGEGSSEFRSRLAGEKLTSDEYGLHQSGCAQALEDGSESSIREKIGEILAAAAMAQWGGRGVTMLYGYRGAGHHGIDQLWVDGTRIFIVEAKGGTGELSDRPAYESEVNCWGLLGYNGRRVGGVSSGMAQMSPEWIFHGCNMLLGKRFTKCVVAGECQPLPFSNTSALNQALFGACLQLWSPATEASAVDAAGRWTRRSGDHLSTAPAVTAYFNRDMGWSLTERAPVALRRVCAFVSFNGLLKEAGQFASQSRIIPAPSPSSSSSVSSSSGGVPSLSVTSSSGGTSSSSVSSSSGGRR